MAENKFDVVIIGSGPGGYVAAIRGAQLGLKVALVEKDKTLGGTCLNVGCIPSKALLQSSENYSAALHDFSEHGIDVSEVKLNLAQMMKRKDKIVSDLTGGIQMLMDSNQVQVFKGTGQIKDAHTVQVGGEKLTTKNILIATGSVPTELPFLKFDGKKVISSTEALALSTVPKTMAVIGGGVIGLELGSVWNRLGSKVHVFEFADRLLPTMDTQIIRDLQRVLKKQGMEFSLSTKVTGAEVKSDKVTLQFEAVSGENKSSVDVDLVLVAVGRRAYTNGLGLEAIGIEVDKMGKVPVNKHWQTKIQNVYAIGDVINGPMLAHKAEEEGVAVMEYIATGYGHVNYECVPGVIYTWPEVASVGATEDDLKSKGHKYKAGTFPFSANGRAKAYGNVDGRVKVLADAESDRVLGVHIIGPNASELIAEAVITMEFGGASEDMARSFHAHPTLAETLREAALEVDGRVRQIPPMRKR